MTNNGPLASWRNHLVLAVFAVVTVGGLFLDGWAHLNLETKLAPFLEPWHTMMYAGFLGGGISILTCNQRPFRFRFSRLPQGYGVAVAGMAIAGLGVAGDALWHVVFGVETGLARVLSTFHVLPFAGTVLVLTTPLRAMWLDSSIGREVSFSRLLPGLLALSFTTAFVAYYLQYLSPFVSWSEANLVQESPATLSGANEVVLMTRVGGILLTTLLLLAPLLVLMRRWIPPQGSATMLFTVVAILMSALNGFALGGLVAAASLGGLLADLLLWRFDGRPGERVHFLAAVVPLGTWSAYFWVLATLYGAVWPLELWMGTVVAASLMGLTLSWLMFSTSPAVSTNPSPSPTRRLIHRPESRWAFDHEPPVEHADSRSVISAPP